MHNFIVLSWLPANLAENGFFLDPPVFTIIKHQSGLAPAKQNIADGVMKIERCPMIYSLDSAFVSSVVALF